MLILLSPAKTMDMSPVTNMPSGTPPLFQKEASFLASQMREYSREQLQILLQTSNKLTDLNYERYQNFDSLSECGKPAILAYTGTVFQHLKPLTFSAADFQYAQKHIRIISTLYGLVRPLDLIKAYRMAYQLKLKGTGNNNLYEYWLPKLTEPLIEDVRECGGILINLASLDVWGALETDKIKAATRFITPEFKEYRKGKYETIRTYAKMARGEMTRYLLLHRTEEPEQIKNFSWDGFEFCEALSSEERYIFVK